MQMPSSSSKFCFTPLVPYLVSTDSAAVAEIITCFRTFYTPCIIRLMGEILKHLFINTCVNFTILNTDSTVRSIRFNIIFPKKVLKYRLSKKSHHISRVAFKPFKLSSSIMLFHLLCSVGHGLRMTSTSECILFYYL